MLRVIKFFLTFLVSVSLIFVFFVNVNSVTKNNSNAYYIVIDCSGSNHDFYLPRGSSYYKSAKEVFSFKGTDPFDLRVAAARILVSLLDEDDQVGVSIFYSEMETDENGIPKDINYSLETNPEFIRYDEIVPMQKIGNIKNRNSIIDNLEAASKSEGLTYMRGIFDRALLTMNSLDEVYDKYVVFFTDGAPTHSYLTPSRYKDFNEMTTVLKSEVVHEAKNTIDNNISVYTVCFENNETKVGDTVIETYDHSFFLQEIAEYSKQINSQGGFFKIKEASDLVSVFTDIFSETKSCFFREFDKNDFEISPITKKISIISVGQNNHVEVFGPDNLEIHDDKNLYFSDQREWYSVFNFINPREGKWRVKTTSDNIFLSLIEDIDLDLGIISPSRGDKLFVNEESDIPIVFSATLKNPKQLDKIDSFSYWVEGVLIEKCNNNIESEIMKFSYPEEPIKCDIDNNTYNVDIPFDIFNDNDIDDYQKQFSMNYKIVFRINDSTNLTYSTAVHNIFLISKQRVLVNNSKLYLFNSWNKDLDETLVFTREVEVAKLPNSEYPKLSGLLKGNIIGNNQEEYSQISFIDDGKELSISIPTNNLQRKNPIFKNQKYTGLLTVKSEDPTYVVYNSGISVEIIYESFVNKFGFWIFLLLLLFCIAVVLFIFKWLSKPYFSGYLRVEGKKYRIKHKTFFRKLLNKTVIVVGNAKKCDVIIPILNKKSCFKIFVTRKKIQSKFRVVMKLNRIQGSLDTSSLDMKIGLQQLDVFSCDGVEIEYLK